MRRVLLIVIACSLVVVLVTFHYSRSWDKALFIEPLHKLSTNKRIVALTFDDGPSLARTPPLLKLLDEFNVKATFFMIGENIEKHSEIAKSVYMQGHLIGNHSYNHARLIFKTPGFISEQIVKTDQLILSLGQESVLYFRPPYSSKYIFLPLALRGMNKRLVTGTYDPPAEYASPFNSIKVAKEVIENTRPGSIIYLHDGQSNFHEEFIESVRLIIVGLRQKGYTFVRLDYDK